MNNIYKDIPKGELKKFKEIIDNYENKKYKTGLKNLNKLLKTNENQSEYISLKGLFLSLITDNLKDKEEGLSLIKKSIMKNTKNAFNWNIKGLYHKHSLEFSENMKSYDICLKFDPDNDKILSDLNNLYFINKEFEKFYQMSKKLMIKMPNMIKYWCSFILAAYLNKNYDKCFELLDSVYKLFRKGENEKVFNNKFIFEIYRFHAFLLFEIKEYEKLINFLKENQDKFIDLIQYNEFLMNCYFELDDQENYEKLLDEQLELMHDNKDYIDKKIKVLWKNKDKTEIEILEELFKKDNSVRYIENRILSEINNIEKFKFYFEKNFENSMKKFIPSYFKNIKVLYNNKEKLKIIDEVFNKDYSNLYKEDPACELFILYILSQHNFLLNNLEKALEYAELGIEHTPTFVEIYWVKAKILERKNKIDEMIDILLDLINFDLNDRYITNYAVKKLLKYHKVEKAHEIFKIFMKNEDSSLKGIHYFQIYWYELAICKSYLKRFKFGPLLHLIHNINSHNKDLIEDQYDFFYHNLSKNFILPIIEGYNFNQLGKYYNNIHLKSMKFVLKTYIKINNYKKYKKYKKDNKTYEDLIKKLNIPEIEYSKKKENKDNEITTNEFDFEDINIEQEMKKLFIEIRCNTNDDSLNKILFDYSLEKENILLMMKYFKKLDRNENFDKIRIKLTFDFCKKNYKDNNINEMIKIFKEKYEDIDLDNNSKLYYNIYYHYYIEKDFKKVEDILNKNDFKDTNIIKICRKLGIINEKLIN